MRSLQFKVILCVGVLYVLAEDGKRRLIRRTKYGRVRETTTELAQVLLGIPYAAPAQRWTAPVEPEPWEGTLDAREAKPMCYQATSCSGDNRVDCIPLKSEDCLYLNIYAPLTTRKNSRTPVLFFMPGGRFNSGTGSGLVYNAEQLVRKGDIIVVTINYRLVIRSEMRSLQFKVILCVGVLYVLAEDGKRRLIRRTKYGRVRETTTELAQVLLGIPYAAPAQRWTAPVEPEPWEGTLDAREAKPMCYQATSCSGDNRVDCIPLKSEDCLYLNIYAPLTTRKNSRKPVLFFMPGGRFNSGTGSGLVYNAEQLVRKGDIIVVTINYRLGAFGFLSTGSSADDITGNYGLMDQRLAMRWVKRNIQKFGGDKNKITIAGQSAGAYSAAIHLVSGKADDLFSQAIMQSSPFTIPLKTVDAAREQAVGFARQANCLIDTSINVTCLRALSSDEIVAKQGSGSATLFSDSQLRTFMPWLPHIDDIEVKTGLLDALSDDSVPPKPLILGTVKDEGLSYVMGGFSDPVSVIVAVFVIPSLVVNSPSGIMNLYPYTNFLDYREQLSEMATDYVFTCPGRRVARALSSRMPVFTYELGQRLNFPEAFPGEPFCVGRVCHGVDLPFVFQSARMEPFLFNQDELALSDEVVTYWANFVKFGNPNRDVNGTRWARISDGKESTVILEADGTGVRNVRGFKGKVCDVWDTTGYQ